MRSDRLYMPVQPEKIILQPTTAPANAGYIHIKSPAGFHYWEELEEKYPPTVFQREWVYGGDKVLEGRVLTIHNTPAKLHKRDPKTGRQEEKALHPLQVALMALPEATEKNFSWIKVLTPVDPNDTTSKATAKKTYRISELIHLAQRIARDKSIQPKKENRVFRMERDGPSWLPRDWQIHDSGILSPVVQ